MKPLIAESALKYAASMLFAIGLMLLGPPAWTAPLRPSPREPSITGPAYALLLDRTNANRRRFAVYTGADSGFNHGFPSGFFGAYDRIDLDTACVDDPASRAGCAQASTTLDTRRGTVMSLPESTSRNRRIGARAAVALGTI